MDLGTSLKQARERTGVSLPDLAGRTRIPLKTLRAIEENDFASVPPGIFARSFIRTYAREVGLDPADAIATYLAMTQPQVRDDPAPRAEEPDEDLTPRSLLNVSESRPGWGYGLIVAALVVAVISFNRGSTPNERVEARPVSPPVEQPAPEASPAAVATTGTALQIDIQALGPCWVRAVVDGQTLFERLLQPGERETVTARHDVLLRVGDPAALSYTVNGKPGPSLGAPEVPVTVRFDASGQTTRAS